MQSGVVTTVIGRKDELEKAYAELKNNFEKFSREKNEGFNKAFEGWEGKFLAIHERIESLLPKALTKGLSAAYSEKKEAELTDHKRLEGRFEKAIITLVIISSMPIIFGIHSLAGGKTTADILLDMRGMLPLTLPLYIPVLWLAYSFNKKMNLSKRLIEEYTHKEVLSKTYEGLSTQIKNIPDSEMSSDLKIRLLYNMLEISSENPGKLISNYNKSDHPLMDALDRSVKLNSAIEYLAKVPGMSKLVGILEKRAEELMDKETKKVADGIDSAISSKTPKIQSENG